jgi:hypothetical protein
VKIYNRADCCGERLNSLTVLGSKNDQNWHNIGALNEVAANGGIYVIPIRSHWKFRYVRLMLSKDVSDYLTLCEVEIYGTRRRRHRHHHIAAQADGVLISRGKEASQSSIGWDGLASYGNDANYNQDYGGKTCTHTQGERNPWWKIDLGARHSVSKVKVWNRRDCCGARLNTLKVQISDNNADWSDIGSLSEQATEGGIYTILTRGEGRYVRLTLAKPDAEYLTLCEVEVYGNALSGSGWLISRGKYASQSSVGWDGTPNLANDGLYGQNYGQKTCSHTNLEKNPWWKIDLGSNHNIESVKVWNRVDCCGERLNSLVVHVSSDNQNWSLAGSLAEQAVNGGVYTISTQGAGRYVRLMLGKDSQDYLQLCEVEVYGSPERAQ